MVFWVLTFLMYSLCISAYNLFSLYWYKRKKADIFSKEQKKPQSFEDIQKEKFELLCKLERLEEITPDKEVFKLKKFWVRDYKDAVRDSEKDGDFTVVEPSIEEKISGKWNMFKSKVFAETPGDFDAIDSNDNDSEPEESQNMGFRSRKIGIKCWY